jgi:hypothetical protein
MEEEIMVAEAASAAAEEDLEVLAEVAEDVNIKFIIRVFYNFNKMK